MRIAQVSPLYESVPPKFYGGTERVVSYLTEELVKQGHDVTLFASGDSVTSARLIPVCSESLRMNPNCQDNIAHYLILMEKVIREMKKFDIIHYHIDYFHFSVSRIFNKIPHITTLHGRLDIPDLVPLYQEYKEMPVCSISFSQRKPLPSINWQGNIYHGLPTNLLQLGAGNGNYLAFLGRVSPEKGLDRAIEIAKRVGIKLKIAAKIDKADEKYFEKEIKDLLDHPLIEYIGEIGEKDKQEFLGNALALLFPINWQEPFGLVMIESMACGTPVIAFGQGSVPEIIDAGKSGFIVNSIGEAVEAVKSLDMISRKNCRDVFERRFSSERMGKDYLALYNDLIQTENNNISYQLTVA